MPGSSPGMTPSVLRLPSSPIQFSNSQASSPVFFVGAGYAVFPPSPFGLRRTGPFSSRQSRGDGAPSGAPVFPSCRTLFWRMRAPLGAPSRLFCPRARVSWFALRFRRAWHHPLLGGRCFSDPKPLQGSQSSEAPRGAAVVPPERGPGASRVRGYESRPQAPHPLPLSERLMTTPSEGGDEAEYSPL